MPSNELFEPEPLPFDKAFVDYTDSKAGHVLLAFRVARTVHVLAATEMEQSEAAEHIRRAGCAERAEIAWGPGGPAACLATLDDLDVVVTDAANFEYYAKLNDDRASRELERFNILLAPDIPAAELGPPAEPARQPFRLASVGGTFNKFHYGHEQYFSLALRLAARIHVYIAADDYARPRKEYQPKPLRVRTGAVVAYFRRIRHYDRVDIETLRDPDDIGRYVVDTKDLDLVLAEHAYVSWFIKWNEERAGQGLRPCVIMCKPRGTRHGVELASSQWEVAEAASADEAMLFDETFPRSKRRRKPRVGEQALHR